MVLAVEVIGSTPTPRNPVPLIVPPSLLMREALVPMLAAEKAELLSRLESSQVVNVDLMTKAAELESEPADIDSRRSQNAAE